ncbi:class I SAM-dependent DNA methyltransferase [Enteractinococcus coprophilus]|uniref:Methyltransferase family protein n=1 Tax=Enteractinococcus coprophilus TaxID=1027633 RepID=A0A543APA2_9MICC|nr:class I SAM-dependent methyltransferase [Enteractinococcus coprophilus]TQL74402.1 methyltransferase family protein [Enteractinococcus coprophilus]
MDDIADAYGSPSMPVEDILGTTVSPDDPDRLIIEPWAKTVHGSILDVGAGTGRWTGHLTHLGYDVTGLEPAQRLVTLARQTHPAARFWVGSIADLTGASQRWAGILAWYSVIHMGPEELQSSVATLRNALTDDGTLLLSFFTGARLEPFDHPVATAYRWPLADITQALAAAGLEVIAQHQSLISPHAYVIAQASSSIVG